MLLRNYHLVPLVLVVMGVGLFTGCRKTETKPPEIHLSSTQWFDLDADTCHVKLRIETGKTIEMHGFASSSEEFQRITPTSISYNGDILGTPDSTGLYTLDLGNESLLGDSFRVEATFGDELISSHGEYLDLDVTTFELPEDYSVGSTLFVSGEPPWHIWQAWLEDGDGSEDSKRWLQIDNVYDGYSYQFQPEDAGKTLFLTLPMVSHQYEYSVTLANTVHIVQRVRVGS